PALLYQDITIALKVEGHVNNGQPTLHAACIAALAVQEGETIVHVGAGTGYYTTILAKMTTSVGVVHAYEIDLGLAQRASENLAELAHVVVHHCSGTAGRLPDCDIVYVSAGATTPLPWLDALRPGGRLLFPLTADRGGGGMLLVTRATGDRFAARFVCGAAFI